MPLRGIALEDSIRNLARLRSTDTVFPAVQQVFGVANTTRASLPYLKPSRGRIANFGWMAGMVGVFGLMAYGAAKYALTDSTKPCG